MLRLLTALLAIVLLLAGCSASSGDQASEAGPADVAQDESMAGAAETPASGADSAGVEEASSVQGDEAAESAGPMMVRRVEMEVLVEDVSAAVTRARATVTGAGGWVESEQVVPGTEDRSGYASLVLRVPSAGLDGAVTSLGELGELTSSSSSAEDVTAEYRDVEARVATLEAGADRLRELVAQAGSIDDIASLERELADREAELDALKARMKALGEDVARSTITLHLAEESGDLGQTGPDTGFLAGLRQGWDAFTTSVTILITALGALLPFLALAALVLVPLLWWRRSRRRPAAPVPSTAAARPARQAAPVESSRDRHPGAAGDPDRS